MSEDNVVSLPGVTISTKGVPLQPHVRCIEVLEGLLQEAKAGTITGLTVTHIGPDGDASYIIVGYAGGYGMLGAAQCVVSELCDIVKANSIEEEL